MTNLPRIYQKRPSRKVACLPPTYQSIRTKLGYMMRHADARQLLHDLEHKQLPPHLQHQRARTFLSLVRLAHMMGTQGNINVQGGFRDLMQMLGYTDPTKLVSDVPMQEEPLRNRLSLYLQQINR